MSCDKNDFCDYYDRNHKYPNKNILYVNYNQGFNGSIKKMEIIPKKGQPFGLEMRLEELAIQQLKVVKPVYKFKWLE